MSDCSSLAIEFDLLYWIVVIKNRSISSITSRFLSLRTFGRFNADDQS